MAGHRFKTMDVKAACPDYMILKEVVVEDNIDIVVN